MKKLALTLKGLAILLNITVQGMELSHKNDLLLDLYKLNEMFQVLQTSGTINHKFCYNDTITNIMLERAVVHSDQKLVTTLLDLGANPDARSLSKIPVFFYAKNSNIAKIFIQHADMHATIANTQTNVLWEVLQHKYPAALLELYLEKGVSPKSISQWDKSCLFHEFAILCQTFQKKDHQSFFRKTNLLLSSAKDMINTLNCNGLTPLDAAKRVFYIERNYARQVNAHRKKNNKSPIISERLKALELLMELYEGSDGVYNKNH